MKPRKLKIDYYEKMEWYLYNNFDPPYDEKTIEGMLKTCEDFQNGKIGLDDEIVEGSGVTVGELFDDLRINLIEEKDPLSPYDENFELN
jgi:hypothetical protein